MTANIFDSIKDTTIERIKKLRELLNLNFVSPDHMKMLMSGSRFNSNDTIFDAFVQNVKERLTKEKGLKFIDVVDDKEALSEIKSMNQQDIDQRLLDALIQKASTDYYYRYEKDY